MKTYEEWVDSYLRWFQLNHPDSTAPREHVLSAVYDEYVHGAKLVEAVGLDNPMERIRAFAVAQGWDDNELLKRIGLWLATKLTLPSDLREYLEYLANEEARAVASMPVASIPPVAKPDIIEIEATIDGREIYLAMTKDEADLVITGLASLRSRLTAHSNMPDSPYDKQVRTIDQLDDAFIRVMRKERK